MREERERAFDEFVEGQSRVLLRLAYALCAGSPHDAEDVLQHALEKAYRHWPRISRSDPLPYVRKIVINTAINGFRRRRARRETWTAEPPESPVAAGYEATELRSEIFAQLRGLPPKQRAVIVLRYWADLSEAETARTLGCSVGSVKSQASRGLDRLRQAFSKEERTRGAA